MSKLSPTMQRALSLADENGGKLYRHPGGIWSGKSYPILIDPPAFSSGTIEALVNRGFFEISEFKSNGAGSFAVEVSIVKK